ncbi:pectinesterase 3-like [Macadamia integrifolia]|uniref:pectinesterase 3-like n=1 Tax=Macadamia integrifolia TaxID=60698 RepID=UPI001C4E5E03|nr:pectinesterase 3-like [Macadamia integrifolia]
MDFIKSFKGYGKVGETENQAFRRKRLIIVAVSAIVLLTVIIAATVGVVAHNDNNDHDEKGATSTSPSSSSSSSSSSPMTLADSIKAVCNVTQFPNSCLSALYSVDKGVMTSNKAADPEVLFKLSMEATVNELSKLSRLADKLIAARVNDDVREKMPLLDCKSLYQEAIYQLNISISSMQYSKGEGDRNKLTLSPSKIDDIKTWLSAALTDLQTCLDGLEETNSTALAEMRQAMQNSTELTSNSLAIVSNIFSLLHDFDIPIHRRKLLGFGFSKWVGPSDHKLLQEEKDREEGNPTKPIVTTVADDGTGKYKTITEVKSASRFVIYVKEGLYKENTVVEKSKWNVMTYGDGTWQE